MKLPVGERPFRLGFGGRSVEGYGRPMDFAIPADIQRTLDQLDEFIEREIKPLQAQDDNERFFDHRREWARTDFENGGVPRAEWEDLLREMRRRADAAGWLRLALPKEFGGRSASNLEMAIIREHLEQGKHGMRTGLGLLDWSNRDPDAMVTLRDRQIVRQLKFLAENDALKK